MKAATEKKKQGLPYGMFFTHMFHALEVDMTGEVREKPKESKEYNKKTLRLMGFMQNEDGEWVKKGVVTPQKGGEGGLDSKEENDDEEATETDRIPTTTRTPMGEHTSISFPSLQLGSSSRMPAPSPHEPRLNSLEASMDEIKEEQKRLGKTMEDMVTSMKTGFDDIKKLLTAHTERFGTLDKDMRALKHQVNNNIHVASNVIQDIVNEFKATSAELQTFVQKSAEDVV
ncbi:hypothetical protein CJ030_MR2G009167 [Morella rubra]|uniref:Uncharacterized protein n=1 Tax=Morella rubra TaxID=262757 RepID=A0A6A1WIT1_9ROSI|nr:hypothetical protein CJ030_MR2G009167 [Morella rubra]